MYALLFGAVFNVLGEWGSLNDHHFYAESSVAQDSRLSIVLFLYWKQDKTKTRSSYSRSRSRQDKTRLVYKIQENLMS